MTSYDSVDSPGVFLLSEYHRSTEPTTPRQTFGHKMRRRAAAGECRIWQWNGRRYVEFR
ncbi:hypothetical protein GCM10009717_05760 [Agromyces allii]|uniref:Uncharacterized protein n=2 Tax=Agromyces allii TaxID=393607 RepID=A0ABN2Q5A4_9MICO